MNIKQFFISEFHNEVAMFLSFGFVAQLIYGFYATAAILVFRPHWRQIKRYWDGNAGRGDLCTKSLWEAIFWRTAPLLFAVVINSKLLFLSVAMDIVGRLLTLYAAHHAEHRFINQVEQRNESIFQHVIKTTSTKFIDAQTVSLDTWTNVVREKTGHLPFFENGKWSTEQIIDGRSVVLNHNDFLSMERYLNELANVKKVTLPTLLNSQKH